VDTLEVLEQYDNALEFQAVVTGDVGGAACAYLAGADRIWVRPGITIGGPVEYDEDVKASAERFDTGFHDQWADRMAERAHANGRSDAFFRAFADKSIALWVADGSIVDSRPSSGSSSSIDTPAAVLSIDSSAMARLKLAEIFVGTPEELGAMLGSERWVEVRRIAESTMERAGEERASIEKAWDETSSILDGLFEEFKRNDPRTYSDYAFELVDYNKRGARTPSRDRDSRLGGFILMPDGRSVELWKQRCASAIRSCEHILEGLRNSAELAERATRAGMRHFILDTEYADEIWREYSASLGYLRNSAGAIPQEILEDLWVQQNPPKP
jgi:hypothetical protein